MRCGLCLFGFKRYFSLYKEHMTKFYTLQQILMYHVVLKYLFLVNFKSIWEKIVFVSVKAIKNCKYKLQIMFFLYCYLGLRFIFFTIIASLLLLSSTIYVFSAVLLTLLIVHMPRERNIFIRGER